MSERPAARDIEQGDLRLAAKAFLVGWTKAQANDAIEALLFDLEPIAAGEDLEEPLF